MSGGRIASLEAVAPGRTLLFRVEPVDGDGEREAILARAGGDSGASGDADAPEGGRVVAWLNDCQHLTDVRLDKGSGAPIRSGEVVCTNHGAMFDLDTGRCTHGPCEGAYLNGVDVTVRDGEVYLDDTDYAFAGLGPTERSFGDRSSRSNLEF